MRPVEMAVTAWIFLALGLTLQYFSTDLTSNLISLGIIIAGLYFSLRLFWTLYIKKAK